MMVEFTIDPRGWYLPADEISRLYLRGVGATAAALDGCSSAQEFGAALVLLVMDGHTVRMKPSAEPKPTDADCPKCGSPFCDGDCVAAAAAKEVANVS